MGDTRPSAAPIRGVKPFFAVVESEFYSYMVQCLLQTYVADVGQAGVVEFGCGTGLPIVNALTRTGYRGRIDSWDLNSECVARANAHAAKAGVGERYVAHHGDFFDGSARAEARCVMGNPPYLPCLTGDIANPGLWGGRDGNGVTREVLSCGFEMVMLIVSSLADPKAVLQHAHSCGYRVVDWTVRPVVMGEYSQEPPVRSRIAELEANGQAHTRGLVYTISGVTWVAGRGSDEADVLLRALTAVDGTT